MPRRRLASAALLLLVACGGGSGAPPDARPDVPADAGPIGPTRLRFDLEDPAFWAVPLPSELRRAADGRVDVSSFPNPTRASFIEVLVSILDGDARGFGATSTLFFPATNALSPEVEAEYADTVRPDAPVFLVGVDPDAPDRGVRYPVEVRFHEDGGPWGADHLLSLLPLQGIPLRPDTLYAAVVTTAVRDAAGDALVPDAALAAVIEGTRPSGMPGEVFDIHRAALAELDAQGTSPATVAGLAVFRTDHPTEALERAREAALARPLPEPLTAPAQTDLYDDFCVYQTTVRMPVYQTGEPPYTSGGGGWTFDASGAPVFVTEEEARFFVTVPRATMPEGGFPTLVMSRTGGGGDRPLVDRGVRDETGAAVEPGSGPARDIARVGWAGVTVDGPHGGLRNVTMADEQFLIFNVQNPLAMRDNVRQSALELALVPHILEGLAFDASDCPGLDTGGAEVRFDTGALALMGHSMGATIAPLTAAIEPRYRALLLSGAGGSWIQNVVHKESPVVVRPFAELLLRVSGRYELHEHDPALALLQWAGEAADPPAYARRVVHEPREGEDPRHVLMMQGIVDTYILPPIANATSLSLGLDLAGPPLDASDPRLDRFTPLAPLLAFSGRGSVELPVSGNVTVGDAVVTAVVVQHEQDAVEDGHEAVFQTEPPKHQYRCFLESLAATGAPAVPVEDGATCE